MDKLSSGTRLAGLVGLAAAIGLGACSSSSAPEQVDTGMTPPPPQGDASSTDPLWCGRGTDVPGAQAPAGFCLKRYAQVSEARTMAFAPNGDLFVGAPSENAPGGASGGPGAIVILSDDDHDGVAEMHLFLTKLDAMGTQPSEVHGLALGGGYLYFTTKFTVWRTPYTDGQRAAVGYPEDLHLPSMYGVGGRWTHGLARSPGGTLYTSRGSYGVCGSVPGGDISTVGADGALSLVANGFRNPMYMRCHRTDEVCAAMELGEDQLTGATEKMLMLHPNSNYGFPCCMTTSKPIAASMGDTCDEVTKEDATFPLSNTPFGFDWETGVWPAPFTNAVFVALHGSAYSSPEWKGAAVVYAPADPTTHMPTQGWQPFQEGWGPSPPSSLLKRPSDIAFAPDGRMFISDDMSGNILWIAPTTQAAPTN
jgi:glucose/arabinose dehydrogenase